PPILAYLVWLTRRSYAQLVPAARWGSLALRSVILLGLIAAISRPAWRGEANEHHLVFVLDVSRSITPENLDAALGDIDRLAREAIQKHGGTRISVVGFGRRPELLIASRAGWSGWPPELREKIQYERSLSGLYAERAKLVSAGKADDRKAL